MKPLLKKHDKTEMFAEVEKTMIELKLVLDLVNKEIQSKLGEENSLHQHLSLVGSKVDHLHTLMKKLSAAYTLRKIIDQSG